MKKETKVFLLSLVIAFFLLSINPIKAFGVSSPYWNDGDSENPLYMSRGEEKIIEINLQNRESNEDETVKAEIVEGQEIAKLKKDIVVVKGNSIDTKFPVEIKIPKNFTPGNYKVKIIFKTITPGESGAVKMGVGMKVSFDVIVGEKILEKPSKIKKEFFYILIILVIVLLIIILMIKKFFVRKNPSKILTKTKKQKK